MPTTRPGCFPGEAIMHDGALQRETGFWCADLGEPCGWPACDCLPKPLIPPTDFAPAHKPTGLVTADGPLTAADLAAIKQHFTAAYAGRRAGGIAVWEGAWGPLPRSAAAADFMLWRRVSGALGGRLAALARQLRVWGGAAWAPR